MHCTVVRVEAAVQFTETRSKGATVGELQYFFRLRHLTTACVGQASAMLFVLTHEDFKQLSATYVEDNSIIMEALITSFSTDGVSTRASDKCGCSFSVPSDSAYDTLPPTPFT